MFRKSYKYEILKSGSVEKIKNFIEFDRDMSFRLAYSRVIHIIYKIRAGNNNGEISE